MTDKPRSSEVMRSGREFTDPRAEKKKPHSFLRAIRAEEESTGRVCPASGCWINILNPLVGELAGLCGYDYAMIDMEHSPTSLESVQHMIRAVQLGGARALVRAPDKQSVWLGKLMDMGADGVMVPMVNTAAEAHRLAEATRYAPEGTRGMAAGIVRASAYGVELDYHLQHYRDDFLLMVQIETREAVAESAEIAAVDDIDCIFIGPFDLSASLGHLAQPDHDDTRAAILQVCENVENTDTLLSTLTTAGCDAQYLFESGFDLVFSGMDIPMLKHSMSKDAAHSRDIITKLKSQ